MVKASLPGTSAFPLDTPTDRANVGRLGFYFTDLRPLWYEENQRNRSRFDHLNTNMVHFLKEIVSNKFIVGGAPVAFEVLDGNIGVIALEESDDNKTLIAELTKACGRYGISKLSEAEYNEKKTLQPFGLSQPRSRQNEKLRVVHTRAPTNPFGRQVHQAAPGGAAVAANGSAPVPGVSVPKAETAVPPSNPQPTPAAQPGSPDTTLPPKFTPAVRRISRRPDAAPAETAGSENV